MSPQPKDPILFELFSDAVQKGLEYVRTADKRRIHIGTHSNWPELRWHDNGLPWVTSTSDGPKDYSDAVVGGFSFLSAMLTGSDEPPSRFDNEPEFLALVDYVKVQPRLRTFFLLEDNDSDFGRIRLKSVVGDLLDRYIHMMDGSLDLQAERLLEVCSPIEAFLFTEELPTQVIVPILFLKFEDERFEIDRDIWVEKLSDDQLLAYGWRGRWERSDNDLVESAATHAFFISGHSIANRNWMVYSRAVMEPESYPVELIDTLFADLRIVTGFPTGYARMLTLPIGWASGYRGNLPYLEGPTVKKYPPLFEQGAWREEVPTVTSEDMNLIRETFTRLQGVLDTSHAAKVRVAMHRLNLSALRTTDEDGIVDAMIAVEALLSDEQQEITHKVAMRLAALYKINRPSETERVFREMKRIYKFRSKIVHGANDAVKYREVDRDGTKVSATSAAIEHLRIAFDVLIKNPALLDPMKIDIFLVTNNIR